MGYKALLVLVIFMVITILLTANEEAPRDLDEKFDQNNDDNNNDPAQVVDKSKQYRGGRSDGFGGRSGYGGGYSGRGGYEGFGDDDYGGSWGCSFGCCIRNLLGGCVKCCAPPQSSHEANKIDAKTHA
ncbi:hypothetical protein PIB30_084009 [Stylosanthes scabra]|uniref:Glycine-rich protein n=1 Tax=Stylosanthes scabra TaxID=79078 RepID=A0ABU6TSX7_9FABA|nr:hypothetical protein [Stylosanthes scabra]